MSAENEADQLSSLKQNAFRSFSVALVCIPLILAENSGLAPIESLSESKLLQVNEKLSSLAVDCVQTGKSDYENIMSSNKLHFKKQQLILAIQLV